MQTIVARLRGIVPQLTVPDLVATAEYYRDVLGFSIAGFWDGERVVAEPGPGTPVHFTIVRRDDVEIFFNRGSTSGLSTGRAEGAYDLYLHIEGLDALVHELEGKGAEIVEGPDERPYGQREIVIRDLNGLHLAFGEPIETRSSRG